MRRFILFMVISFTVVVQAQEQPVSSGRLDILRDVAEDGFLRATTIKPFNFPKDHGPHNGYRHEWWYATGNLDGPDGKRFGYELTFFRLALTAEKEASTSAWKASEVYAAHFAVTDVENKDFHFFDRYSRGDGRLAGAKAEPFKVWLDDWSLEQSGDVWKLTASEGDIHLNLNLSQIKPTIFQGEEGLSRKSAETGNATYYYSLPRLKSSGSLELGGDTYPVNGLTWLDREWGTSALASDQQGWDWFALHLSDGSDLMFYNLRKMDGSKHAFSAGAWLDAAGNKKQLKADDITIEVTDHWDSPLGGRYPSGWILKWQDRDLELIIKPMIKNQELNTIPRYWEGAVDVEGQHAGNELSGRGYVELTGYSK